MFPAGPGPDIMFSVVPTIVSIIFIVVIALFIIIAFKGLTQWNANNHSPVLTVVAKIVARRTNVSHHSHHDAGNMGMQHSSSSTSYYVTFEFESGDRLELHVPCHEFGYLIEGDMGRLTFQGTRYKGFQRDI